VAAGLSRRSLAVISDFGRMTARLRSFAGREPLDEFVSRVLGETFLLELCAAAYHHEQTAANLGKYRRLARDANESRGATLKEFIAEVVRSMGDDSLKEGESPLADEQFDAVRILSIHKAKGLEYGTVFLADMGGQINRGGSGRSTCRVDWSTGRVGLRLNDAKAADLAMAFIERRERERDEAEALRLLYVAMTRAKSRLFLLGGAAPGSTASFSEFLSRVGAWPAQVEVDGKKQLEPLEDFRPHEKLGLDFQMIDLSKPRAATTDKSTSPIRAILRLDGKALAEKWRVSFDEGRRLAASHVFTSPTAYLKEAEKTGLPEEFASSVSALPRRCPGRSREEAALVGEVCHRVLEFWDHARPGDLEAGLKSARAAIARRRPAAPWDVLTAEARGILKGFFATEAARALARCEIMGREIPFVFPHGGKVVRGSIDLLCRQDGRLWVVDYKTDEGKAKKGAKISNYRRQGAVYVEAVRRALGEAAGFKILHLRDGAITEVALGQS
ncbi:MAG TPA: hypothetical protein DCZ01_01330, partial [Elusimicrobia bacterium]|nr:hypothetical protein [Elusimicrobiota bacterium]